MRTQTSTNEKSFLWSLKVHEVNFQKLINLSGNPSNQFELNMQMMNIQ